MTTKTRNWLLAIFILAFPLALFCGFLIFMEGEPLPPLAPLPNPNGYGDLVKAGGMIKGDVWNENKVNLEELRGLVLTNAAALALARSALSNQCGVTLAFSATSPAHLEDLSGMKLLAFAFVADGRLAEMENRPSDAVQSYLETIHLGIESSQGGTVIDQLDGIAIEALGASRIQKIASKLGVAGCRDTAAALESLDSQRQTWSETMRQEYAWSRRSFTGLKNELVRITQRKSVERINQESENNYKELEQKTRQLMIDLAARAYELDKGHPPASAADLVPDYLKAVPQDPVTGTNMVYSP